MKRSVTALIANTKSLNIKSLNFLQGGVTSKRGDCYVATKQLELGTMVAAAMAVSAPNNSLSISTVPPP